MNPAVPFFVDRSKMNALAREALTRVGSPVNPTVVASDLSRAELQQVEIARALVRDARVLILDEPTSALTSSETATLFLVLGELKAAGTAIIFISHRIPEVLANADRITVMKDGEIVGTIPVEEANADRLVHMMVGRDIGVAYPARALSFDGEILAVENLRDVTGAEASFRLCRSEILGFGGVQGAGQERLQEPFSVSTAGLERFASMTAPFLRLPPLQPSPTVSSMFRPSDAKKVFLAHIAFAKT